MILVLFLVALVLSTPDKPDSGEVWDQRLADSAHERAECIDSGRCPWSHQGYKETISKNYRYGVAAENLARNYPTWDEVYNAWNNSPSHERILKMKLCNYGTAHVGKVFVLHKACP